MKGKPVKIRRGPRHCNRVRNRKKPLHGWIAKRGCPCGKARE